MRTAVPTAAVNHISRGGMAWPAALYTMMLSIITAGLLVVPAYASVLVGTQPNKKASSSSPRLLSEDFIELHNSNPASTWTAGKTPFSDMTVDEFSAMMGDNPKPTEYKPTLVAEWPLQAEWERMTAANITFPEWFDPRHRWHWCPTLSQIRDQGMCGSCWAHGVTEALSDRYCTMANITTSFSAHDVSFCCKGCGAGCGGGDPEKALKYLNATGAFTSTCVPYDQGDHRSHHPWPQPKGTDKCPAKCEDSETLAASRHKGTIPYNVPLNKTAIMLELMVNGPSGNQMTVYGDFGSYKGGVYYTECGKKSPLGKKCQAWGHGTRARPHVHTLLQ